MNDSENIYHRYLELPFTYPKPEIFNSPTDGYAILFDSNNIFSPFADWIASFGLTISNVLECFYTKPNGGQVPLHADTIYLPGTQDVCKLNFTWGPLSSTTKWYKIKDDQKLVTYRFPIDQKTNNKFYQAGIIPDIDISQVLIAEWEDVDLAYEAVIDKPSLINVSQLHSTWNPSPDQHRWSLCFTLLENEKILTFERANEIFKNFIIDKIKTG
jgi:hypothetical protein